MNTNQHLILLRGLPGAGKTAFAKLISENNLYPFYSVDDFFTDEDGTYKFIFSENYKAYEQCIKNAENALLKGHLKVIIHNTFTMNWELEPYFILSKKYHCNLFVLTVENFHNGINGHDVTSEQIKRMADKYQVKLF